jgi:DNA adenine methylase
MNENLKPILKWVGGKRQLVPSLLPLMPKSFDLYCEPFLGGGALLFSIQPNKAIVNDINPELISLYKVVKEDVSSLIKELLTYKNDEEFFYKIRNIDRDLKKFNKLSLVKKAARTYYLNKSCFNGLYRVNRKGQFNSPYGHYKSAFVPDIKALNSLSEYLNTSDISIFNGSYLNLLDKLDSKSFVYLDPPYDPVSVSSSFTNYSKLGFSREDQVSLRDFCKELDKRNINFMLSNSATEFIKELYKDFDISIVKARRFINSKGNGRGFIEEVVIRNYK